jgi:redox-sensitive bicupin YhaK (pirin superfamily)
MITVTRRESLRNMGDEASPCIRHLGTAERDVWFGDIRVFNDDTLPPGALSPPHEHRDVETVTYVVDGTYLHVDAAGRREKVPAGSVQLVSFASGIKHADGNADPDRPVRVIQVWIQAPTGDPAATTQKVMVDWEAADSRWLPIVAPAGPDESSSGDTAPIRIHQEVRLFVARLQAPAAVSHRFRPRSIGYVFALDGDVHLATDDDAAEMDEGGGARIIDEVGFSLRARTASGRVLLVETMNAFH